MKRTISFILLASSLTVPAWAETNIGISVNIGDAPPPPVVVVRAEPRLVYVSSARCWVVNDERWEDDCFRHGRHWYTYRGGYWYRSKSWRGPFRVIETRYVPVAIHQIPARHWKRYPNHDHARHVSDRSKHHDRHAHHASDRSRNHRHDRGNYQHRHDRDRDHHADNKHRRD